MEPLSTTESALLRLGRLLRATGYVFVTPTPETHRRVNARPGAGEARHLRDVFGWSRPFRPSLIDPQMLEALAEAGTLESSAGLLRSRVRLSSLGSRFFFHSAFPTIEADSVFFGPDTYRFANLIEMALGASRGRRFATIIDIGCGSGAGGLLAAAALAEPPDRLILADISERALSFARVNAALNEIAAETRVSDILRSIPERPDLIVANPPFLVDPAGRLYRDGGGALGADLSLRILRQGLERLRPGGAFILYTATAILAGRDPLRAAVEPMLASSAHSDWRYREIDPDIFGEELESAPYREADRIAAVALVVGIPMTENEFR